MVVDSRKAHCLGVGGVGLSGVAALLRARGCDVSGCDARISAQTRAWLGACGVRVLDGGHDPSHVDAERPGLVVRSAAVAEDHPELLRAREAGARILRRGEALAELVGDWRGVAVCGTHGKTTTSCFAVALLRLLGFPGTGWCIGGHTAAMGGVARPPDAGAPFVAEADESDGTLALYRPAVTVVTAVDVDHLEHFDSFAGLKACFRAVCDGTSGRIAYCAESAAACEAAARPGAIGYGFCGAARLRAADVSCGADGSSFDVWLDGRLAGRARLGVPGRHNVLNALGAVGACVALGLDPGEAVRALSALDELPLRRYEIHAAASGLQIVSDYSHHPAEIRALVETSLLRPRRRLVGVFQPHRYTRTRALAADFPAAFRGLDELVLLPVYAASERPLPGGRGADLYRAFREANAADAAVPVPKLATSLRAAADYFASPAAGLGAGDVLLVVGAGDVVQLVPTLEGAHAAPSPAPGRSAPACEPRVSYGLPVAADDYEEVRDEASLAAAMAGGARVMGQGTNLLVSDLGVRGRVVRLRLEDVSARADGVTVDVGCGLSGARLLAWLRDAGLSGLEFMAGIPGTVGGWLAMNAGTRLGAVGDCVESVVAYAADGRRVEASRADCGFSYRRCGFLAGKAAARATFRLRRGEGGEIARRMEACRAARFDFSGLRTAGSVFRNPPGDSAGRLLDEAGCKGLRVGGAFVCGRHANVVAAEAGATASDVLALMEIMHGRVLAGAGVDLEREVRVW